MLFLFVDIETHIQIKKHLDPALCIYKYYWNKLNPIPYCCDMTSLLAEGTGKTEQTSLLTRLRVDINFNNRGQQSMFMFDSQFI